MVTAHCLSIATTPTDAFSDDFFSLSVPFKIYKNMCVLVRIKHAFTRISPGILWVQVSVVVFSSLVVTVNGSATEGLSKAASSST